MRGAWHAAARELHADGATISEIAARLGKTYGGVYKALNPEKAKYYQRLDTPTPARNAAKRASADRNRGDCVDCGAPLSEGSAWRDTKWCWPCEAKQRHQRHEELLERVARMWDTGMTYAEISEALGLKGVSGACSELFELRRRGRIGYRHTAYEEKAA